MPNNSKQKDNSSELLLKPLEYKASISWHNLQVFSRMPKKYCRKQTEEPKEIIRNVSGAVKAGQFLAIMGSSGAGKTTLLNVLTGRNLSQVLVKGEVRLNGQVIDNKIMKTLSAYVQQEDLFMPTLTVREHLIFHALLRMDKKYSKKERYVRVNQLLKEFSLAKCAETRIGSSITFKGISGGESKRLSFASELLTNPSIMFCDEPTSGLDSFMAENIVNILKYMSSNGRTIICTIHQPSSQVFSLFEQLLLMADGRVAFMGKLADAMNFFSSQGINCPQNFNPSDFYIRQLSIIPGEEIECKQKVNTICDNYLKSPFANGMIGDNDRTNFTDEKTMNSLKALSSEYRTNCIRQQSTLLWRSFTTISREPMITQIRIVQTFIIAVILGVVYWQQNLDQKGIMNINGALYLLLTSVSFDSTYAVVESFCAEMPIFLRDYHNGMYRVDVYFISKMLAEIPIFTLTPIIFVATFYYMVGFNPAFTTFLIALLITILVSYCSVSFGYIMSCISSSANMALSLGPPLLTPLMLFGGLFLNTTSIPVIFAWMKYISWFYYGFEALVINQWRNIKSIDCGFPQTNLTQTLGVCLSSGKDVIKQLDFDENHFYRDLIMLIVLTIGYRLIAYLALYFKARKDWKI